MSGDTTAGRYYDATKRDPAEVISEALDYLWGYAGGPSVEAEGQRSDGQVALKRLLAELSVLRERAEQAEQERDEAERERFWHEAEAAAAEARAAEAERERDSQAAYWAERAEAAERRLEQAQEAMTIERVKRVLWKQTIDANLNTDEGCEQAARVLADYFAALAADPTQPPLTEEGLELPVQAETSAPGTRAAIGATSATRTGEPDQPSSVSGGESADKSDGAPDEEAIQSGEAPATTIRQLVDAQRQNFAGAGADLSTLVRLLNRGDGVLPEVWAAIERLERHLKAADAKATLAFDASSALPAVERPDTGETT